MDASTFANPLEIVQYISIFSYVNTLSDFLYTENYLLEDEQYKRIPIVNALYDYLRDYDHNREKKEELIRKLLERSDLYGENENETLSVHFANTMFDHIITSLVFDKYRNIHGFFAEMIRSSNNVTIQSFNKHILETLSTMTFENEYGNYSTLTLYSVTRIYADLILPLFPQPQNDMSIISVDYIYAMAGLMFLRTGRINSAYYSDLSVSHVNIANIGVSDTIFFYLQNNHAKLTNFETFQNIISVPDSSFNEYIGIGHAIEELVVTEKLDKSALSIFALPALLNFAISEKETYHKQDIGDIIDDPTHWTEAYNLLFSYLNVTFKEIQKAHENDYRYQLHLALSNFKTRTELARQTIRRFCPLLSENDMTIAVREYLVQTDYACKNGTANELLPNINELYEKQNNFIRNKYFNYEKEMIRKAFDKDLIESIDAEELFIIKGSVIRYDCDSKNPDCRPTELIKPSDDLLEFYYPRNNDLSLFYALIRKDDNVTLIKEADNSTLFRHKLGIGIEPFEKHWNTPYKVMDQNFDGFLFKLAEVRANKFKERLNQISTPYRKKNWWEDFGLSLIPFYSCITSTIKGHLAETTFYCPMDMMFAFPIISESKYFVKRITMIETQNLLHEVGTTVQSMLLRGSIRSVVNIERNTHLEKKSKLETLVSEKIFENLKGTLHRLVDPGFELASTIGRKGMSSLIVFFSAIKNKLNVPLKSIKEMLERTDVIISSDSRKIGEKNGQDMHVKVLFKKDSGYGYKFLKLSDGKVAYLRKIRHKDGSIAEIPVVEVGVSKKNEKLYKSVDLQTGMIKEDASHFYDEEYGFLVDYSEPKSYKLVLKSYDDVSCSQRLKRSPSAKSFCIRTNNLKKKLDRENEAIAIGQWKFSEQHIRDVLRRYIFPEEGKSEKDFVEEWLKNGNEPEWSDEYRIDEHEHFFNLKYTVRLDTINIMKEEAMKRIQPLYSKWKQEIIQRGTLMENMAQEYMEAEAYNSVLFEDYYALRNFMANGFKRISETTDEARRMKYAIYTLAIRQSDDPIEEYATTLYRGEVRSRKYLNKFFSGKKEFELSRFTSTSSDESVAEVFGFSCFQPGYRGVLYKINFQKNIPYFRANVDKVYETIEEETILLPGSKFKIDKVTGFRDSKKTMIVELSFIHEEPTKLEWQKNIMKEIKEFKNSNTAFYYQDIPMKTSSREEKDCCLQ